MGMSLPATRIALPFRDRIEAGRCLAECLKQFRGTRPVVLGIPRGGVPVAAEVAKALNGDLDVIVTRKLGAPGAPELAIGAISADGLRFLNQDILRTLNVSPQYLDQEATRQLRAAREREASLRAGKPRVPLEGRTVIVIDDGLATGATMHAAVQALRAAKVARLIVGVPVGSREACASLDEVADEVICLAKPEPFRAVGIHYVDFQPVEDTDVTRLLVPARSSS